MNNKRYVSLDVMRGITVLFMCIVNNPGTWYRIYEPLCHSAWNGCTPTDLVYPFFIFCMGCAMAFSFTKYDSFNGKACRKVLRRSAAIFAIGIAINFFPFFPTKLHDPEWSFFQNYAYWFTRVCRHLRILAVLQRIALAYLVAGLLALWLRKPRRVMVAVAVLLILHTAVLVIFGKDPGPFTLEGNVAGRIDTALFGSKHVFHGYCFPDGTPADFDPEGLLGTLSAAASCLIGYLVGSMIIFSQRDPEVPSAGLSEPEANYHMVCRMFVYGLMSLGFAEILNIWVPINKPLWTCSYVFLTSGWAMLVLAFLIYCIDIRKVEKPFYPFKVAGFNALTAFILCGIAERLFEVLHFEPSVWFGANEATSLCYALLFTGVIYLVLQILYNRKICIKL